MELSVIITIIGVLVALTNIVVQVLKTSTWEKLPTNLLALIVAGFMVAYAAMFGFDKLKEIMNWSDRK